MHTHDALQRRNRYRPSSTGKRVTLKARDHEWLEFIARHGPLPSDFLHAVTEKTYQSGKAARMRLTDLSSETNTPHGGTYLVRPGAQRQIENARNKPLLYDLSEAGWTAIGKTRADAIRATGPFRHQVMVACVTASLELACREHPGVSYIPAERILGNAADLGVDLTGDDANTGKSQRHRLVPDQLFALAYETTAGTRYRAFAVECDRATEPVTSPSLARKSYLRSYLEYRAFIGDGLYKERYGLKCPLLVLNVMTSKARLKHFMQVIERQAPQGNAYFLFRQVDDFKAGLVPRAVLSGLLTKPWERVGHPPMTLAAS